MATYTAKSRAEWEELAALRRDIYESYVRLAKETPLREGWTKENREEHHAKTKEANYYWRKSDKWHKTMKFAETRALSVWKKQRATLANGESRGFIPRRTAKPKPTKYVGRATVVYEPKTLPPVPPRPIPAGHYLG